MVKKFEADSIGGGIEQAGSLPKGALPSDIRQGRALDGAVYGQLPDEMPSIPKIDTGRKVAQPMALAEIRPDPRQPRRAIPSMFMRLGDGDIGIALELWAADACRVFYPDAKLATPRMAEMLVETVLSNDDNMAGLEDAHAQAKAFVELAQLARTIHQDGLINPISIGKAESGAGYWIESGERRYLAYTLLARYVEFKRYMKIPAIVGERVSVWKQAAENGARRPLNAIGMARQLALLVMDMYPEAGFEALDEMDEQAFYAQVADGNKWRILPSRLNDVLAVTGLKSQAQIAHYRRLLKIPREVWEQADAEDWAEGRIREEAFPTAGTFTIVNVGEGKEAARDGIPTESTITIVMVGEENEGERDPQIVEKTANAIARFEALNTFISEIVPSQVLEKRRSTVANYFQVLATTKERPSQYRILAVLEQELERYAADARDEVALFAPSVPTPTATATPDKPILSKPNVAWDVPIAALMAIDMAWRAGKSEVRHEDRLYAVVDGQWQIVAQVQAGEEAPALEQARAALEQTFSADDTGAMAQIVTALQGKELAIVDLMKATGKGAGTVTRALERLLKRGAISERRLDGPNSWIVYRLAGALTVADGDSLKDTAKDEVVRVPEEVLEIVRYFLNTPLIFMLLSNTPAPEQRILRELVVDANGGIKDSETVSKAELVQVIGPAFGWLEGQVQGLMDVLGKWYNEAIS